MATEDRKPRPYWLSGTEICEACGHSYVLQQEYRCAACDAALCEHCADVDAAAREAFCAGCRERDGGR